MKLPSLLLPALLPALALAQTTTLTFSGDPTDIDGYPGTPGGGWTSAWNNTANLVNGSPVYEAGIQSTAPFVNGSGSTYLNFATTDGLTGGDINNQGAVSRSYGDIGGLDLSEPHQIQFLFRKNTDTGQARIYDTAGGGNLGGSANWIILVSEEDQFRVFDSDFGTGFFNGQQDMSGDFDNVVTGNEYLITISVRPAAGRYDTVIEDLSGGGSVTYMDARFRSQGLAVSGTFTMNSGGDEGPVNFDIDSLSVIPEPSLYAALLGLGALFLAVRRRR
ncbi:MAG: PEP-CTERM sorting domain-containing protein [Opitutales bacterium]|nr:PEP-CTERM sorting domain-containing protein [Opitutales bacterium]